MYQYHQLLREFLLHRAAAVFSAAENAAIRRQGAALLEQAGQFSDAIEIRLALQDWAEAARLILSVAPGLTKLSRHEVVRAWIDRLPWSVVERTPSLLYWRALSLMPVDPKTSRSDFERAFCLFRDRGERTGLFLAWSGAADVGIHEIEYGRTLDWLEALRALLAENPSYPSHELEVRVALSRFNAMALCHPDHPDIAEVRERALHLFRAEPITDPGLYLISGVFLTVNLLWQGDLVMARVVSDLLRKAAQKDGMTGLGLITVKATEALYRFFANDLDGCIQAVREALAESDRSGVRIWDTHNLGHGLAAALAKNEPELIAEFSARMAQGLELSRRADQGYYHFLHCWKSLREKNHNAGRLHFELGFDHLTSSGFFAGTAGIVIGMAMLCSAAGKHKDAERYFTEGQEMAIRMKSDYLKMLYSLGMAHDCLLLREEDEAVPHLREGLRLGRRRSLENLYFWQDEIMARLCLKALEEDIETDYVLCLVRKRGLTPATPPLHLEIWPWPLRIFTLGRFAIERDGKPLSFAGKLPKKPLELLKILISFGGQDVSEERLTEILWPDSEGDAAKQSLAITIHRLRKLLTDDAAVLVFDGRVSLNNRRVWVDAWLFMQADGARQKGKSAQGNVMTMEKTIGLYLGNFLPGDESAAWSLPVRDQIRRRHNGFITRIGRKLLDGGDLDQARRHFERGIELDDLAEELYQELMECLMKMGRRDEAAVRYQQCRKQLLTRRGKHPSRRTEEIYQTLQNKT